MDRWTLVAVVTLTWLLWVVVGLLELRADKLERKRPADAGFSAVPVVPLFPLALLGAAYFVDAIKAPWGTLGVFWLHIALAAGCFWAIARALYRARLAKARLPSG